MRHVIPLLFVVLFSIVASSVLSSDVRAQTPSSDAAQQPQSTAGLLKPEELDQLVAPIALYPDALLAEVLMASTYPLEVVEGDRWVKANSNLKGDQLKAAVDKQTWDQSIKSLAATPEVLMMMSSKLDWTQKLGDAVLAQQQDIMDAVQRLRAKADANNKLTTTKQQKITKTQENNKSVIIIEPAAPDTIYVPYYNPAVVYGAWPYPAYPPYYWGAPGYVAGAVVATGIAFGAGYAIGRWASGGSYWGGGLGWGNNNINVNRQINVNNNFINNNNTWRHNPDHRHGVQYRNDSVRQKFGGNNNLAAGRDRRMDFRGRDGQQVLRPDANRPGGAGNRPGGDRPGANFGDRGGNKPGANRPDRGSAKIPNRSGDRPNVGSRGGGAFAQMDRGNVAKSLGDRGRASVGNRPQMQSLGGGGFRGVGGGGFHAGGGGGFRGGGLGRRR